MKFAIAVVLLTLSSLCWSWNCPAGQIRQQAPAGTPTTTPYYDVVEGIAFICTSSTPAGVSNTNTNSVNAANTNTNTANSAANSNSTSTSSSTQSQQQAQKQQQGQSQNATATATGNGVGNGNGSNNTTTTVEAPRIPVTTAVAPPVLPTVPCFKGVGGGLQTPMVGGSFGGGKVDAGCDDRELARAFSGPQTIASCKILVNTKKAKKAGITMEDCLPKPIVQAIAPPVIQVQAPPQVVIIPVTTPLPVLAPPQYRTEITVRPPAKRRHLPPACQNVIQKVCEK